MVRLMVHYYNEDKFAQAEWVDGAGVHSRRVTEEMPATVLTALDTVMAWLGPYMQAIVPAVERGARLADLERAINLLQQEAAKLRAR